MHSLPPPYLFNCIILMPSPCFPALNPHRPPASPPPPHYPSSFPFLLCPSLTLPRACLSGSVPVCLFADDSTWSRCDAQQLLLCSITLPSHLSLWLFRCLPSNVSLMHLSACPIFFVVVCRHAAAQLLIGDLHFMFLLPDLVYLP